MWQLDNRTPFAAERGWVRDRDGAEIWIVAVKCSFAFKPDGSTEIAAEQPPVTVAPVPMDPQDPIRSSLRYESDLVRCKTTTDILLHGHAHAPGGAPTTACDVGFCVGRVIKQLRVTGDRFWQNGAPSAPEPFTLMPLVYERAYGGADPESVSAGQPRWETRNPAGCGFAASLAGAGGRKLPNIEYREHQLAGWNDRPPPAGFGPVACHWQPRARLAGTYDAAWQANLFPLLPVDFDDRHYQSTPADQQSPAFLSGGETVRLLNVCPVPLLTFTLPRLFLGFETFFSNGERALHDKPRLHSVILEPDDWRVSLVWHSALPCHPKVLKLQKTRIILKRMLGETVQQAA